MKRAVLGIVIYSKERSVLLLKRCDVPVWVLPGGGIDDGELPKDAIVREVKEETGLDVIVIRQVAEYTPVNRLTSLTYVFECKVTGGTLSTGPEAGEIGFYPIDKLHPDFFHIHKEWLDDALKNLPDIIHRPISSVTYWKLFTYFCKHPVRVMRVLLSRAGFPINSK